MNGKRMAGTASDRFRLRMRTRRYRAWLGERILVACALVLIAGLSAVIPTACWAISKDGERVPPAESKAPVPVVSMVIPADPEEIQEAPEHSEQELEVLALLIYQEAGGDACSDSTRQMVGEVALNRVADPRYPDTIFEVATQRAQYGRLYWTGLVWPARADKPGEAHAIERAYACAAALLTGSVDRLLPKDTVFQAEFQQGVEVVAVQDGLYFCR